MKVFVSNYWEEGDSSGYSIGNVFLSKDAAIKDAQEQLRLGADEVFVSHEELSEHRGLHRLKIIFEAKRVNDND